MRGTSPGRRRRRRCPRFRCRACSFVALRRRRRKAATVEDYCGAERKSVAGGSAGGELACWCLEQTGLPEVTARIRVDQQAGCNCARTRSPKRRLWYGAFVAIGSRRDTLVPICREGHRVTRPLSESGHLTGTRPAPEIPPHGPALPSRLRRERCERSTQSRRELTWRDRTRGSHDGFALVSGLGCATSTRYVPSAPGQASLATVSRETCPCNRRAVQTIARANLRLGSPLLNPLRSQDVAFSSRTDDHRSYPRPTMGTDPVDCVGASDTAYVCRHVPRPKKASLPTQAYCASAVPRPGDVRRSVQVVPGRSPTRWVAAFGHTDRNLCSWAPPSSGGR